MAKKTYRAYGSIVSLGLYVNGMNIRVSFSPVSNYEAGKGGSEFVTDDEEIQHALESRRDFGQMFVLYESEETTEEQANEQAVELRHIQVGSLSDAKIWLMDNCGWEPSSRITKKSIADVAEAYGVVFDGI